MFYIYIKGAVESYWAIVWDILYLLMIFVLSLSRLILVIRCRPNSHKLQQTLFITCRSPSSSCLTIYYLSFSSSAWACEKFKLKLILFEVSPSCATTWYKQEASRNKQNLTKPETKSYFRPWTWSWTWAGPRRSAWWWWARRTTWSSASSDTCRWRSTSLLFTSTTRANLSRWIFTLNHKTFNLNFYTNPKSSKSLNTIFYLLITYSSSSFKRDKRSVFATSTL